MSKAALANHPEYRKLIRADGTVGDTSGNLAARNLRTLLKQKWPDAKFSVRKRDYGAISVRWEDGPAKRDVEAVAALFDDHKFDAHDDYHWRRQNDFQQLFGSYSYVDIKRDESPELIAKCIDAVLKKVHLTDDIKSMVTVENFNSGRLLDLNRSSNCLNLQALIRDELSKTSADTTAKAPKRNRESTAAPGM